MDMRGPPCAECGSPTLTPRNKYCGVRCANTAIGKAKRARRAVLTCEWCGNEHQPRYRGTDPQRYCSVQCTREAYGDSIRVHWPSSAISIIDCGWCGEPFTTHGYRLYCSRVCGMRMSQWRQFPKSDGAKDRECSVCGVAYCSLFGAPSVFCSQACRKVRLREWKKVGRMRRRAQKRGAHVFSYRRVEIFQRDRWTCQLCGTPVDRRCKVPHPRAPVLDHIVPLAAGGDEAPWNVQAAHFMCNSRKAAGSWGSQLHLRMV